MPPLANVSPISVSFFGIPTLEAKSKVPSEVIVLTVLAQSLAEKMYAEQAESASGDGQDGTQDNDGDVVDAEFEEVEDDKKTS